MKFSAETKKKKFIKDKWEIIATVDMLHVDGGEWDGSSEQENGMQQPGTQRHTESGQLKLWIM